MKFQDRRTPEPEEEDTGDLRIISQTSLFGMESSIQAVGAPEAIGLPVFQLTFFERGHAMLHNVEGKFPLWYVISALQQYIQEAEENPESLIVPRDIVDRGETEEGEEDAE